MRTERSNKMDKEVGETVKFTKDLHCKFLAEEIENLTAYNPLLKRFQASECWASDGKQSSLFIGGFNVEVNENRAMFFYGHPIDYGFLLNEPTKLIFIPPGHRIKSLITINSMHFEKEYKRPSTMWDLGMFIDDYIYYVVNIMDECALQFQSEVSVLYQSNCESTEDDGLPF